MSRKRRKRHTPEQIVRKLRDADAMLQRREGTGGRAAGARSVARRRTLPLAGTGTAG